MGWTPSRTISRTVLADRGRVLLQQPDAVALAHGQIAAEARVPARDDVQECRLARTVQAEDTDLGPVIKAQADVFQDLPVGREGPADPRHGEDDLRIGSMNSFYTNRGPQVQARLWHRFASALLVPIMDRNGPLFVCNHFRRGESYDRKEDSMTAPSGRSIRILQIAVILLILTNGFLFLSLQRMKTRPARFGEIDAERINIVEKDGTLKLALFNSARLTRGPTSGKRKIGSPECCSTMRTELNAAAWSIWGRKRRPDRTPARV